MILFVNENINMSVWSIYPFFSPTTGQHGDNDRIMTLHSLYNTFHSRKLTTSANPVIARAYMVLSEEFFINKLPVWVKGEIYRLYKRL